jgi:hypothetical protein
MTGYQTIPVSLRLLTQIPTKDGLGGQPKLPAMLMGNDAVIIKSVKSYAYANGWHIFGFQARTVTPGQSDTLYLDGADSIKILSGGLALALFDSSTMVDTLMERAHMVFQRVSGTASGVIHHQNRVSFAYGGADTMMVLDGVEKDTSFIYLDRDSSRCEIKLRQEQTVTGLTITTAAEEGDCPLAGGIALRVKINALCIGIGKPPVDTSIIRGPWTVDADIAGDHEVTITYSNGAGGWSRTSDCKGPDAPPFTP